MITYMLDSSFCIDVMRNKTPALLDRFKAESAKMALSTIALHELLYGADNSQHPKNARSKVLEFAAHVQVTDFDDAAASHAGGIRAKLRQQGQSIGAYDVLIAGHARSLNLTVITGNIGEFSRVDGLRCEDWLASEDIP